MKGDLVQTKSSGINRFPCRGCLGTEPTRRDFLATTSCALVAALVASGIDAKAVMSLQFDTARPVSEQGSERSYAIPARDIISMDPDSQVILVRQSNQIMVLSLGCPHQNAALQWRPKDKRFQCPLHGAKYQPDGTFQSGPATRNMDRFAIRLNKEWVVVDFDKLYRSDQQKADWSAAVITIQEKMSG
jgi:nitrite reductase/ring-hydroxylating ferredoxin subunit